MRVTMGSHQNFHEGEKQLQTEDGIDVETFESVMTEPFSPQLNPVEIRFVNGRTFAVAGSVDPLGRPWSTPLFGPAEKLLTVENPTTVRVRPGLATGHPLLTDIADNGELGILYFDPALRRRAKSLGSAVVEADNSILYRMSRNFGVCNRYIFKRLHEPPSHESPSHESPDISLVIPDHGGNSEYSTRPELGEGDNRLLTRADTTFLASRHSERGVETTHRGGPAGFISIDDATTISLPDYPGNGMFNTLGNLLLDDRVGLTAIDFGNGRVVQITGRGQIVQSPEQDPMSTRTLRLRIAAVCSYTADIGGWVDVEAFPVKPGMYNPGTPYLPGREPANRR